MSREKLIFLGLILFSSEAFSAPSICGSLLHAIAVAPLTNISFNKKEIKAEIEENDGGGQYLVRLYVKANSPENLDGNVAIGWVRLNTAKLTAYDTTQDPDNSTPMKTNRETYARYVASCINNAK